MLSSAEASSGIQHQALQTLILLRGAVTEIEVETLCRAIPSVRTLSHR